MCKTRAIYRLRYYTDQDVASCCYTGCAQAPYNIWKLSRQVGSYSYISFSEDRIYVLAKHNSDGTTHVLRDLQKISVKAGTTSLAANFKILAVNLSSGSEAFCLSRSFNSFNTHSRVISIVSIDGNV